MSDTPGDMPRAWTPSERQQERDAYRRGRARRSTGVALLSTLVLTAAVVLGLRASPGWPRVKASFFDPEVVVLGGSLAQVWRAAEGQVREAMSRSTMMPRDDVLVRAAQLGGDSPLVGAAELAFMPVLDHPQAVPQPV